MTLEDFAHETKQNQLQQNTSQNAAVQADVAVPSSMPL